MIRIAICDDDVFFIEKAKRVITEISNNYGTTCEFKEYSSGESLLSDLSSVVRCDILVLDILMDGINGMETARKIREINTEVRVLFASSHIKFATEGYFVNAVGYILKDDFFERNITAVLDLLIPIIIDLNREIVLKTHSGSYRIRVSRIMCVESNNHFVTYYLSRNQSYSVRERFSDVANNMSKYDFILIHRGCIVNPSFIKSINRSFLVLEPDWEINVSRDLYKSVKQKYQMFKQFSL